MSSVGICGTDVHCWLDGGIEGGTTVSGLVTGHEGAGIVNKLGEGVTHLDIGKLNYFFVFLTPTI